MKKIMLAMLMVFALMGESRAEEFTGNKLKALCEVEPVCLLYIKGWLGGFNTALVMNGIKKSKQICIPYNSNSNQLTAVLIKYMKNYPEELHKPAFIMPLKAFEEAFPC